MTANLITTDANQAADWLKQGCLLAYPTESVWGIGCDAYNEEAVHNILAIKQRPIGKGLIVVTDSVARIAPLLAVLSDAQRKQVVSSWQTQETLINNQAQTWLLPLSNEDKRDRINIPSWITGQHDSVAMRVIAHPLIQSLCKHMVSNRNPYGFIVSTSCNPSGQPPARTFNEAYAYFGQQDRPDCQVGFLQGGTLRYTQPSQIMDAETGNIIR